MTSIIITYKIMGIDSTVASSELVLMTHLRLFKEYESLHVRQRSAVVLQVLQLEEQAGQVIVLPEVS
jgi:hypothetical protein